MLFKATRANSRVVIILCPKMCVFQRIDQPSACDLELLRPTIIESPNMAFNNRSAMYARCGHNLSSDSDYFKILTHE